jgi:hypothetical protein
VKLGSPRRSGCYCRNAEGHALFSELAAAACWQMGAVLTMFNAFVPTAIGG